MRDESMALIYWSELKTPEGDAPGPDDVIVINSNDHIVFDGIGGDIKVKSIVVYGGLSVDPIVEEMSLEADWILVAPGGKFEIGTPEEPFKGKFQITLAGKDQENTINLSDYPDLNVNSMATMDGSMDPSNMMGMSIHNNNAFLMAMGENAEIIIHADDVNKKSWAQLDGTVSSGETTIKLSEVTGWEVGDQIAIASTDFDLNQSEHFEIIEISSDGTIIKLDRPLSYMHYGDIETYSTGSSEIGLDMRAEVVLISRDIVIQGDVNYDKSLPLSEQVDQYGGHTMVMNGGAMYISGVEFAYMGQAGIVGRYPAHWHLSGDAEGQYIENSSFHHTFNKGITIHGTQNIRLEDNTVVESIGHSFYFEDGSEVGNYIIGNLGMGTRRPISLDQATTRADFFHPSTFWIENADNVFVGNHAAGTEGSGFYFDLRGVNGLSKRIDSFSQYDHQEGPQNFVGNVSHSAQENAFYLDQPGLVRDRDPSGDDANPQKVDPWIVEDFTAYKVGRVGVYVRGIEGVFVDLKIAEADEGTRFRLNQGVDGGLIVGRTENIGNPQSHDEILSGRSLPPRDGNYTGHQLYDGPAGLKDVHFDGFHHEGDYAIASSSAITVSTSHYVVGLTWGGEDTMPWTNRLKLGVGSLEDKRAVEMLVDIDGSLTEIEGGAVVGNDVYSHKMNGSKNAYGFNRTVDAISFEEWIAHASPNTFIGTLTIRTVTEGGNFQRGETPYDVSEFHVDVIRDDGPFLDQLTVGDNTNHRQITIVEGHSYEMIFANAPPEFQFYMSNMPEGESVFYKIDGLHLNSNLFLNDPNTGERSVISEVSSMEALELASETSVFRNVDDGNLYLKFTSEMFHGWHLPQPQETFKGVLLGGVVVNVDQRPTELIDLDDIVFDDVIAYYGTASDDNLVGASADEIFIGGLGNDKLVGNAGHDTLMGDQGNDLLISEARGLYGTDVSEQIYRIYKAVFGREPDVNGHQYWVTQLASTARTHVEISQGFILSPEFQQTYGTTTDENFVTLLYQNVLGRKPDPGGVEAWLTNLENGMSRQQVVRYFAESPENKASTKDAQTDFDDRWDTAAWAGEAYALYQAVFDRDPNAAEFDDMVLSLTGSPSLDAAVNSLMASAEFQDAFGSTTDAQFVSQIYQNLLGSAQGAGNLAAWTSALAAGVDRAEVIIGILQTPLAVAGTQYALKSYMLSLGLDDVLEAGSGNDVLSGGLYSDSFVFDTTDDGTHTVTDLEAWDKIDISDFGYADVDAAFAHMNQQDDDVVFQDQGVTVVFSDVAIQDVTDDMLTLF
jgi:Ca2+-binding RTX toxin-like protein